MSPSLHAMLSRLADPNHLWLSQSFSEALARLHFTVEHGHELAIVVGIPGIGSTSLLRQFRRELLKLPAYTIWLNVSGSTAADLSSEIALQLGVDDSRWSRVRRRIAELGADDTSLVVLADDAASASAESFDCLARLWNADWSGKARVSLVLATHELDLARWSNEWLERVGLRVDLDEWSLEDVRSFLNSAVGAEVKRGRGFDGEAVESIHQIAAGLPRQVRRLAQLSLIAAESQGRGVVDAATVVGVSHEFCRMAAVHHQESTAIEFVDELS